ncbi:MAG: DivIVA domain-containing protein [Holophaga sp.]|nr:DivIVA domain-containing protein [Holophaga sp.]
MKFTPLDIQRREFEKAFRGLNEGEVRTFLHEVAGEWEELQLENQRLRTEILDLREHLREYQEQDRIFRETLLHAQRTKEEILDTVNREKALILKEADFKADELIREAQAHVVELETQVRSLKLERVRFLQDMDSLVGRSRRFLQEEAPEMFPSPEAARKAEEREAARLEPGGAPPAAVPNGPRPPQAPVRKLKD